MKKTEKILESLKKIHEESSKGLSKEELRDKIIKFIESQELETSKGRPITTKIDKNELVVLQDHVMATGNSWIVGVKKSAMTFECEGETFKLFAKSADFAASVGFYNYDTDIFYNTITRESTLEKELGILWETWAMVVENNFSVKERKEYTKRDIEDAIGTMIDAWDIKVKSGEKASVLPLHGFVFYDKNFEVLEINLDTSRCLVAFSPTNERVEIQREVVPLGMYDEKSRTFAKLYGDFIIGSLGDWIKAVSDEAEEKFTRAINNFLTATSPEFYAFRLGTENTSLVNCNAADAKGEDTFIKEYWDELETGRGRFVTMFKVKNLAKTFASYRRMNGTSKFDTDRNHIPSVKGEYIGRMVSNSNDGNWYSFPKNGAWEAEKIKTIDIAKIIDKAEKIYRQKNNYKGKDIDVEDLPIAQAIEELFGI